MINNSLSDPVEMRPQLCLTDGQPNCCQLLSVQFSRCVSAHTHTHTHTNKPISHTLAGKQRNFLTSRGAKALYLKYMSFLSSAASVGCKYKARGCDGVNTPVKVNFQLEYLCCVMLVNVWVQVWSAGIFLLFFLHSRRKPNRFQKMSESNCINACLNLHSYERRIFLLILTNWFIYSE